MPGEPRRYFRNRAHALYFLRGVAPTKLVDGAWLHGLLPHWHEQRFQGLVRTYLEELGEGVPAQNHVLIYQRLLARHGCDDLDGLMDALQARGWIRRHEPPTTSRFWQLTEGKGSAMFGVFSPYEKQLLHDWIAGDWLATPAAAPRPWRCPLPQSQVPASVNGEFNAEGRALEAELSGLDAGGKLARLIHLMAPAAHHRPAGLLATRLFMAQTG